MTIAQSDAPVQIESCSALAVNSSSTPVYGRSDVSTLMDSSGHITYAGPAQTVDQQIPMTPMYAGTRVFGTAESVNRSVKTVTGVVYQFDVLDKKKKIGSFFGPRTGEFGKNDPVTPYSVGAQSPWSVDVTQPGVDTVTCLVAFVRFSDGTSWQSPLAYVPPERQSSP